MHPLIKKQIAAKRVLVTGDRYWANRKVIARELGMCAAMEELIHGDCPTGADYSADLIGRILLGDRHVTACPADWATHGRSAGPIRNQEMLDEHHPDFVLAFHNNLSESKGTLDMITRAKKAGIPVKIIAS